MNLETYEYDKDIKLDAYGHVDVDYYHAKAVAMRAQCTREIFHYAVNGAKALLTTIINRLVGPRSQPSH